MAKPRKAPDMPIVSPKDGEVERRNAYTRLNPNGDEELVIKRVGKQDEETLNELADDLMGLLEGIEFAGLPAMSAEQPNWQRAVNQPNAPQLVASRGDPARVSGETLTNMTVAPQTSDLGLGLGPTPADGPDLSRAKSPLRSNPRGGKPTSKYISDYDGDGLDYGATHSESFTGTGAIAIAPLAFGSQPSSAKPKKRRRSEDKDTNTSRLESDMSTRRNPEVLAEWLPTFKGAGYNPGEYEMPEPGGKGVAERTPTNDTVGEYDTDTSASGKEWPRDHNETAAMCDVDDDGVEHKSQGGHNSTHAEADDGIQDEVGHNWPDQPKNSGQGVAEPFGGSRWSDGGTLNGQGPGSDTWTHEEGPGMPSEGPITGTSGPQLGQPTNESWSPQNMARYMGEEVDLQALFDSYARTASAVCLEDFQTLCDAHGCDAVLDESSLMHLMDQNQEFMFYEGRDSDGPYWTAEAITEGDLEGENSRPFDECNDTQGGMKPRKKKKVARETANRERPTLNEMQIRSPEHEANLYRSSGPEGYGPRTDMDNLYDDPDEFESRYGGDPQLGHDLAPEGFGAYDDRLKEGPLPGSGLECPGCGYQGEEAECPECGAEMMDPMEGIADELGGGDEFGGGPGGEFDDYNPLEMREGPRDREPGRMPFESREVRTGPGIVESLKNFMTSARSIIERNPQARQRDLAEALNYSWRFHAGDVDARTCPSKVRQTLEGLMNKFPGFSPLLENDAMEKPDGTKLGGGDGPKENLPKQPTEMTTHGEKSLLGKHQTNNLEGTPTIPGTAKGMTGKSVNEQVVGGRPVSKMLGGTGGTAGPAFPGVPKPTTVRRPGAPAQQQQAAPPNRPPNQQTPPAQQPAAPAQQQQQPAAQAQQQKPAAPQGAATQAVQENIARLGGHIKRRIMEGAKALRGKYNLVFSVMVAEAKKDMPDFIKDKIEGKKGKSKDKKDGPPKGKKDGPPVPPKGKKGKKDEGNPFAEKSKKRTPPRDNLAEALADAEELLQIHNPNDVTFEATFLGPQGQVAMKQDIPLFTILPRGPMVGEGKALFRFHRTAEAFADRLAEEGVTCRITPHNWGSAVQAQTNYTTASRAFDMISEDGEKKKKWMR